MILLKTLCSIYVQYVMITAQNMFMSCTWANTCPAGVLGNQLMLWSQVLNKLQPSFNWHGQKETNATSLTHNDLRLQGISTYLWLSNAALLSAHGWLMARPIVSVTVRFESRWAGGSGGSFEDAAERLYLWTGVRGGLLPWRPSPSTMALK